MIVTSVEVAYSETRSLPGSSNVKASVSFSIDLHPGDNHDEIAAAAMADAKHGVRATIRQKLLKCGIVPEDYNGPTFWIVELINYGHVEPSCIAVIPKDTDLPEGYVIARYDTETLPLVIAVERGESLSDDYACLFFNCYLGDLSDLPKYEGPEPVDENADKDDIPF